MATRELAEIKDKNGDVNELRDKKLADSIAKNTVVNTDNVRMVDTNGKEVFIARDSFISAIRNVLGGFILSNTKAEAPNIPVFDSNGDFGAITAANLASVLGVGSGNLVKISGVAGQGYLHSDMLLKDYSYVIAFAYVREPSNINMDIKLSKLYLDTNNSMREESIASYRENNLVSAYYSLNNGYIRTVMWNDGKGYVLFFGFK